MAREVWGIDIGRSALKAVRMRRFRDGVEITDVDHIPYDDIEDDGSVQTGRSRGTWQALAEFQARHRVRREKVIVSVPGSDTFTRGLQLVMVGRKSVHEIVQYEAHQQIPFVLDEVIWDYEVFDGADPDSREREGLIFAVKKNLLNNYFLSLSAANLPVDDVQPTPVALYNFFMHDQEIGKATLVIDVGSESTNLLAMTHTEFWVRSIPVGGRKATQTLADEFDLDLERAEAAKLNLAKSKHARDVLEMILPAIMELVGEVQKSLAYQRTQGKEYNFDQVVLLGGGANLLGLRKMLKRSLGMEVLQLDQFGMIEIAEDLDVGLLAQDLGSFAVAIGLGLHGCGYTSIDVSLIPQRAARKSMLGRTKPYFTAAPSILLATCLIAFGFAKYRSTRLWELYYDTVEPQVQEMGDLQKQLQEAKDVSKILADIERIQALGRGRGAYLDLFDVLMDGVLPDNTKSGTKPHSKLWLIDLVLREPAAEDEMVEDTSGRGRLKASLTAGFLMSKGEAENNAFYRAQNNVIARLKSSPRLVTESIKFINGWPRSQLHEEAATPKAGEKAYYVFKVEFEFYTGP